MRDELPGAHATTVGGLGATASAVRPTHSKALKRGIAA
jgi:hypothetical protein